MIERHDPETVIATFFDRGPTTLADRVYERVRSEVDRHPRRARPQTRIQATRHLWLFAVLAILTTIVVGVLAGIGRPRPTPEQLAVPPAPSIATPSLDGATDDPGPSSRPVPSPLAPGPYQMTVAVLPMWLDLPPAWRPATSLSGITRAGPADEPAANIRATTIDHYFPQGCHLPMLTRRVSALTAGQLAAELQRAANVATTSEELEIDGHPSVMVTVDVPVAGCGDRLTNLWVEGTGQFMAAAPGSHHHLLLIDGPDGTGVVDAFVPAGDPPERRDEVERILRSARAVEPVEPGPSAAAPTAGTSPVTLQADGFKATLELPTGWSLSTTGREARFAAQDGRSTPIIRLTRIDSVYPDPCDRPHQGFEGSIEDADGLADRIVAAAGYRGVYEATTLAGHDAIRVDVEVPNDLTECRDPLLDLWASGPRLEAASPGEQHVIFAFDIDGRTVAIDVETEPGGPSWAEAGVDGILESLTVTAAAPDGFEASAPATSAGPTERRVLELDGVRVALDVPTDWQWWAEGTEITRPVPGQALGPAIRIMTIDVVFKDCKLPYFIHSPVVDRTADDLADQIEATSWYHTARRDREIDGWPVVDIQIDVPDDLSACARTSGNLWANDARFEFAVAGDHHHLLIVDVRGRRIVIDGDVGADDPPSAAAEVAAILRTATFEVAPSAP